MNSQLIIGGVVVLILGTGVVVAVSQSEDDNSQAVMSQDYSDENDSMMEDDKAMDKEESMEKEDESMMEEVSSRGRYVDFDESEFTSQNNVIFFSASWCPTCRSLDEAILSNVDSLPANLTILKADYDSEKDLKKKYGVTYQHTLVQVDNEGNMMKKWSGSQNVEQIASQLI